MENGYLQRMIYRNGVFDKFGDWETVFCVLDENGKCTIYTDRGGQVVVSFCVSECEIRQVRLQGKECILVEKARTKKEIFTNAKDGLIISDWLKRFQKACDEESNRKCRKPRKPMLQAHTRRFERFTVYETCEMMYIVGSDRYYSRFRLIVLDRRIEEPTCLKEILTEDKVERSWEEMEAKLQFIDEEAKITGQGNLKRVLSAVALVGFVKFIKGYYVTFVTQRRKVGCIGGNFVYGIQSTQQIAIAANRKSTSVMEYLKSWLNPNPLDEAEARYLGLFHFLDLTKDFFFSYSYDLTRSLQQNMTYHEARPCQEMFVWNQYLTQEFSNAVSENTALDLVQPIVYGSFEQRKCSVFGRLISVMLLARRSRHFAGTRYLKRGIADNGMAANDVEVEQIIEDESMGEGRFSSFVQCRGSIPIFWTQETSATMPKPPIVLNRVDPTYAATKKHFINLMERYGSPVTILNLVKQSEKREREVIVGSEYTNAVEYINGFLPAEHRLRYVALDYSRISKQKDLNVLRALDEVAVWSIRQTGFFCSAPKRLIEEIPDSHNGQNPIFAGLDEHIDRSYYFVAQRSKDWLEQNGVLRTNCIDSLDRTNVGQFSVGMRALGQQLYCMGLRNTPLLESRSELVRVLMHLYSGVGDVVSMQYGGSEAHKNVKDGPGREKVKHRELLTSIRRYYSNSFTDMVKQDSINIFLGNFVPKLGHKPLWEMDSDYYLHNKNVSVGSSNTCVSQNPRPKNRVASGSNNSVEEIFQSLRKRRRDAYERARVNSEWWVEPIQKFAIQKSVPETRKSVACSERFIRLYHTRELTNFDKALSYKFMNPLDLSHDHYDDHMDSYEARASESEMRREKQRNERSSRSSIGGNDLFWKPVEILGRAKAALATAAEVVAPPSSDSAGLTSMEEFAASKGVDLTESNQTNYVGSCQASKALDVYEEYVKLKEYAPTVNEKEDRKRSAWYRKVYLRDFEIDPNDPKAVRNAQIRAGATFTIKESPYDGLNQQVKARHKLSLFVKEDMEARRVYKESIDMNRLTRPPELLAPARTHALYKSYFDTNESNGLQSAESTTQSMYPELASPVLDTPNKIQPVGPLYRYPGSGKEFILFNSIAAENDFGIGLSQDSDMSFYNKY